MIFWSNFPIANVGPAATHLRFGINILRNVRRNVMRRAMRTAILLASVGTLVWCGSTLAQDWPQWRGANRDAKASGFKAPATWPKSLTKKWQTKVGDGVASPALAAGKLYVFAREGDEEILHYLNAANGTEVWKQGYDEEPARGAAGTFPGPRSSPTVAGGKVVTLGVRGVLTCRDAGSGKQLWQKDELAKSWPMFFTSSSPLVVGSVCAAQLGGPQDGGILAYDLTSGDEKWRWMESGPAYASPVLMNVGGTDLIIAATEGGRNEGKLVAFSVANGKPLWDMPYSEVRYIATTPIVEGSTLIVGGPGTGITAFKLKKQGDKLTEEKLWSNADNSLGFNTPVVKDGLLFGLSAADQLFCINTQSQKTAWTKPIANAAAGEKSGEKKAAERMRRNKVSVILAQFVQQDEPKKDEAKKSDQNQTQRPVEGRRGRFGEGPGRGPGGPGGTGGFRRPGGMGRGMGRSGYGSIVDVGSALLALSPAGELVVFQPSADAYKELARYKVAEGGTYAYPIPTANGIYVKDADSITLWSIE